MVGLGFKFRFVCWIVKVWIFYFRVVLLFVVFGIWILIVFSFVCFDLIYVFMFIKIVFYFRFISFYGVFIVY